jgi:hypothetical protein
VPPRTPAVVCLAIDDPVAIELEVGTDVIVERQGALDAHK